MQQFRFFLSALCVALLFSVSSLHAGEITIASGAGYKRPFVQIISHYQEATGNKVTAVYGNMRQVISQAEMSGQVALIIGDQKFFDRSGLEFDAFYPVGQGRLVLAWRQGVGVETMSDIAGSNVTRVGMPDPVKAIYGFAANEYLENSGLMPEVSERLIRLGTVPQVSAYLLSGDIDAGFINATDALGLQENIGGFLVAEEALYTPIAINAGVLKGFGENADVAGFIEFLQSPDAQELLKRYGL